MANLPARGRLLPAAAFALALAGCALQLPTVSEPPPPPKEPTPAEKGLKPMTGAEVRTVLNKARYRGQGAQGAGFRSFGDLASRSRRRLAVRAREIGSDGGQALRVPAKESAEHRNYWWRRGRVRGRGAIA